MSTADVLVLDSSSDVASVLVDDLTVRQFRRDGLCAEQIERFVDATGDWPPILVRRADHVVIDGAHRVAAAQRLGLRRVAVTYFEGSADDGFIEFVRRNVARGLPLSVEDRKRAARRVLLTHPVWSDRRVAELCVLSPKTVARVRATAGTSDDPSSDGPGLIRIGRDNRVRPVVQGSARARALEALRERPDASLRAIAEKASVSPETVRQARVHLDSEQEPVLADASSEPPEVPGSIEPEPWVQDPALSSSEEGSAFVEWFEQTRVGDDDLSRVDSIPLSRVYVVADEARRRSETWLAIARFLEAKPGKRR